MSSEPALIPLKSAHHLLTTFTTFLTVSIHSLLFYRNLYPPQTFLTARFHNLPVHQNRHPKVCAWITAAVASVSSQLSLGTVARVAVVVHAPLRSQPTPSHLSSVPPGAVLERYVFDVSRFPAWPGGPAAMRDYERSLRRSDEEEDDARFAPAAPDEDDEERKERERREGRVNWTDVDEQFRGVLRRLSYAAERLDKLPEGCTFTVAVELRDEAKAPIGVSTDCFYPYSDDGCEMLTDETQHPQPWIPSEPNLQTPDGSDLGGAKTTPIRSVEAGPLFFECWVEEGKAKDMLKHAMQTQESTQSSMS